jgi:hypothetical protein
LTNVGRTAGNYRLSVVVVVVLLSWLIGVCVVVVVF